MNTINDDIKLASELSKYRRVCKCGHAMTFYRTSRRNKIVCTHCGNYVYKNDLIEFKEKMNDLRKNKKV